MGTVVVYENTYTTGQGIGFDNGPGSEDDDSDDNATIVLDTRTGYWREGTVVVEWQEDGVTHRGSVIYDYVISAPVPNGLYVILLAHSIGGAQAAVLSGFYLKPTYLDFYTGDGLLEYIYSGNDRFYGSIAGDTLYGYAGSDTLYGNGGNDKLVGGYGQDYLFGGPGNDILIGGVAINSGAGWSNDYYYGGSGHDIMENNWGRNDLLITRNPSTGEVTIFWENGLQLASIASDVEEIKGANFQLDTSELLYVGGYSEASSNAAVPVYRFYNNQKDTYFYTADSNEKVNVLFNSNYARPDDQEWPYVFQGSTFNAASTGSSNVKLLHRFFNADTGHHLWSMDPEEIAIIKNTLPNYDYEGPSFYVYGSDPNPSDPNIGELVYRYYNSTTGKHFWTADAEERNLIQLTGVWVEEGPAFWGE